MIRSERIAEFLRCFLITLASSHPSSLARDALAIWAPLPLGCHDYPPPMDLILFGYIAFTERISVLWCLCSRCCTVFVVDAVCLGWQVTYVHSEVHECVDRVSGDCVQQNAHCLGFLSFWDFGFRGFRSVSSGSFGGSLSKESHSLCFLSLVILPRCLWSVGGRLVGSNLFTRVLVSTK